MRKICLVCGLFCALSLPSASQNIIYPTLKSLLAQEGDTVAALRVEKRSQSRIMLTGGADYRIEAGENGSMRRRLKKRTFAVRADDGRLYVNCRKLRYKKLRFGSWYAPAVLLDGNLYFCAVPLGSVVGGNFVEKGDVKLGGKIGEALAASGLVNKRVCYELNVRLRKIEFLSEERMLWLLRDRPDLRDAYLRGGNQEARNTFGCLLRLAEGE